MPLPNGTRTFVQGPNGPIEVIAGNYNGIPTAFIPSTGQQLYGDTLSSIRYSSPSLHPVAPNTGIVGPANALPNQPGPGIQAQPIPAASGAIPNGPSSSGGGLINTPPPTPINQSVGGGYTTATPAPVTSSGSTYPSTPISFGSLKPTPGATSQDVFSSFLNPQTKSISAPAPSTVSTNNPYQTPSGSTPYTGRAGRGGGFARSGYGGGSSLGFGGGGYGRGR